MLNLLRNVKRRYFRSLTATIERRLLHTWFAQAALNGNVLDIGGGSSPYAHYLHRNARLINLDIEPTAATSVIADAHNLPFAPGSLDAVVCTNVLEHLRDPRTSILQITDALRTGGEFIVIVPFMFKVHPNPEDHWRFTWQCLEYLFADHYEVVDKFVSGGRFAVIWEIICQTRVLELLRVLNPILARLPLSNPDYALSYCYRLRKTS